MKTFLFLTAVLLLISCDPPHAGAYAWTERLGSRCRSSCRALGLEVFEIEIGPGAEADRCHCRAADGGAQ